MVHITLHDGIAIEPLPVKRVVADVTGIMPQFSVRLML